jgi:hypothetical protein
MVLHAVGAHETGKRFFKDIEIHNGILLGILFGIGCFVVRRPMLSLLAGGLKQQPKRKPYRSLTTNSQDGGAMYLHACHYHVIQ